MLVRNEWRCVKIDYVINDIAGNFTIWPYAESFDPNPLGKAEEDG